MTNHTGKRENSKEHAVVDSAGRRPSTRVATAPTTTWHAHQAVFKWMFFITLAALITISLMAGWMQRADAPTPVTEIAVNAPSAANEAVDAAAPNRAMTPVAARVSAVTSEDGPTLLEQLGALFQNGLAAWPDVQALSGGFGGYVFLGLLVAIEGPIATLFGAAAAATGALSLPWVFVAATVGNLGADIFWYWIGRSGRLDRVARFGRLVRLRPEQVYRLSDQLQQNTVKVLFVAKITAGLVIPTLIAAGLIRASWRKWFPPIFIGETLWTGVLVLLGYYATSFLFQVERTIGYLIVGGSVLFFLAIVYAVRRTLRHGNTNDQQ